MAEWEDIINNRLTMGRSRWLTYAANAERRRREDEERRPGARPPTGRGEAQTSQIFTLGEIREENFQGIMLRGRSRLTFTPQPFIQVHHVFPLQFPVAMYGPFGHVNPNAPVLP